MKICAYVQEQYTKTAYRNESLDARQFVGLKVIVDSLERAGYEVEYAGIATVHIYDIVLVSLTSDCDWWSFIEERTRWQSGNYKVIIGGAGLMHITPFLPFGDYFSFGRGEQSVVELVRALDGKGDCNSDSICDVDTGKNRYTRISRVNLWQGRNQIYTRAIEVWRQQTGGSVSVYGSCI